MIHRHITIWSDRLGYWFADLDRGPKAGPYRSFQEAKFAACDAHDNPFLPVFGSCPTRFLEKQSDAVGCFTQQMAETYSDNRG